MARHDWVEQRGAWITRTPEAEDAALRLVYAAGVRRVQENAAMRAMSKKPLLRI